MLSVAVFDQNQKDRREISSMLRELSPETCSGCAVKEISREGELFLSNQSPRPYHLVMINAEMRNDAGFSAARLLRQKGYCGFLVFYSASADQAVRAIPLHAHDYLLKPIHRSLLSRLLIAVERELSNSGNSLFPVATKKGTFLVRCQDILYLESRKHRLILHLRDGTSFSFSEKLDRAEGCMAEKKVIGMVRCHKSYLVNAACIREVHPNCLVTEGNRQIPVSRSRKSETLRLCREYLGVSF